MYFKKFYAGQIESNTERERVVDDRGNSIDDYINQGAVVRNAVVESLAACGAEAFVEDGSCVINVNGFRFSIYYLNTMRMAIYSNGAIIYSPTNNDRYGQPFDNLGYKFYVTIKGNLKTSFNIYISAYNEASTYETKGIGISYVTTIIKKQKRVIVRKVDGEKAETGSVGYIRGIDGSLVDGQSYNNQVTFKLSISFSDYEWNDLGHSFSLIPLFDLYGYCTFDGVFIRNTNKMPVGNFYNLNDKLFYVMNYNMLVEIDE